MKSPLNLRSISGPVVLAVLLVGLPRCQCIVAEYDIQPAGDATLPGGDAGPVDAVALDQPQIDGGTGNDSSAPDTSVADSNRPDTLLPDTRLPDALLPDTALVDSAAPDTALADTLLPDTALPDTLQPDAATPDTAVEDAGPEDAAVEDATEDAAVEDTGPEDTGPEDTGPEDRGPEDTLGEDVCTPDCTDLCGGADDGCGGSCDAACTLGQWCDSQACVACDSAEHCSLDGFACDDCTSGTTDLVCVNRACGCVADTDCALGEWCDVDTCVACDVPEHCAPPGNLCLDCAGGSSDFDCISLACGCDDIGDCALGERCNGVTCDDCDLDTLCGLDGVACVNCSTQSTNKRCVNRVCGCTSAASHCDTSEVCDADECILPFDECAAGSDDCDPCNGVCADALRGWTCSCRSGHTSIGPDCSYDDDGAITLTPGPHNLSTDTLASGRSCADGVSYSVTTLAAGYAILSETPAACCLGMGDEVLLINLRGDSGATANVGNYEFLTVDYVTMSTVHFTLPKSNFYGSGGSNDADIGTGAGQQRVMLMRIPTYTDVTINGGAVLSADAFDGLKGGLLALRATGGIYVNGEIDMRGAGYRGGAATCYDVMNYRNRAQAGESISGPGPAGQRSDSMPTSVTWTAAAAANSGGGGAGCYHSTNCESSGAAGGYGTAGDDAPCPCASFCFTACNLDGDGGVVYGSQDLSAEIFLGSGGGGSGHRIDHCGSPTPGVAGGGAVMLLGGSVVVTGRIYVDGLQASAGAYESGGAGSGGSVYISGGGVDVGTDLITAQGGPAAISPAEATAGGDGRIMLEDSSGAPVGTTLPVAYTP